MKIAVVAITRHGITLAGRVVAALHELSLPACVFVPEKFHAEAEAIVPGVVTGYTGKTGDQIPTLFAAFDGLIAIISLGAMVRLIAPHLTSKTIDPAVLVLDEGGTFVIPILSGHLGGANALAGQLAVVAVGVAKERQNRRQTELRRRAMKLGEPLGGHQPPPDPVGVIADQRVR